MRSELAYAHDWERKREDARQARDRWINLARERGCTLQAIADATGMTPAGVKKIVDRV